MLGKPLAYMTEITSEQIRSMGRDYNPSEWDKTIDRYLRYSDVKFYVVANDEVYGYERYFVTYTTDEGIKFLKSVSYGGMLSSTGLVEIWFDPFGGVRTVGFGPDGKGRADKSSEKNREHFAKMSREFGTIYTSEF